MVSAFTLDFLRKDQILKAITEHNIRFTIFTNRENNRLNWACEAPETNKKEFNSIEEFIEFESATA